VSPDSVKSHRRFIDRHGLKIILLSDTGHRVLKEYSVWKIKRGYGREFYGVIRSTFLIDPEGKIIKVWRNVKVPGHVDDVLDILKSLT